MKKQHKQVTMMHVETKVLLIYKKVNYNKETLLFPCSCGYFCPCLVFVGDTMPISRSQRDMWFVEKLW